MRTEFSKILSMPWLQRKDRFYDSARDIAGYESGLSYWVSGVGRLLTLVHVNKILSYKLQLVIHLLDA